jgi:hypothetical protein
VRNFRIIRYLCRGRYLTQRFVTISALLPRRWATKRMLLCRQLTQE